MQSLTWQITDCCNGRNLYSEFQKIHITSSFVLTEEVSKILCVLVNFLSRWHKLKLSGKRTSTEKNATIKLRIGKSIDIFLINDLYRRAQPMVGSVTLGHVVLGCVRKQINSESKPVSGVPSWPLLQLLPPGSFLEFLPLCPFILDCDWGKKAEINSFLPKLVSVMVFVTAVGS